MGLEIVQTFLQAEHIVCGLIAEETDSAFAVCQRDGIPCFPLPEFLRGTRKQIQEKIDEPEFQHWLDIHQPQQPDCGIVFYGGWVPPVFSRFPRLGFLNIHPAPLPALAGYEAERFHVLKDYRRSRGVIHQVDDQFDRGVPIAYGDEIDLPENMTPMDVYEMLIDGCKRPLLNVMDCIARDEELPTVEPIGGPVETATLKDARAESVIDWNRDTHRKIDCRLRAFNTTDDDLILKAPLGGRLWVVRNILLAEGTFPGVCGERIGTYHEKGPFEGTPIVRTTEGVAALEIGGLSSSAHEPIPCDPRLILPRGSRCGKLLTDQSTFD